VHELSTLRVAGEHDLRVGASGCGL
jgi:hypothetical protein